MARAKTTTESETTTEAAAAELPPEAVTSEADVAPATEPTAPEPAADAPAHSAPDAVTAEPIPVLIVHGPAHGRWRAGRHFTSEGTTIPLAELSDDEVEAIFADPVLGAVKTHI